jgi:hypothetical protein
LNPGKGKRLCCFQNSWSCCGIQQPLISSLGDAKWGGGEGPWNEGYKLYHRKSIRQAARYTMTSLVITVVVALYCISDPSMSTVRTTEGLKTQLALEQVDLHLVPR